MFILTLETNIYTGNFERELCAYMTGQIGDCEIGEDQADIALFEQPEFVERMVANICQKPNEYGCRRPVECIGNSLEIYFDEKPSDEDMMLMLRRAQMYNKDIKILTNKFEEEIITRKLISYKTGANIAYSIQSRRYGKDANL